MIQKLAMRVKAAVLSAAHHAEAVDSCSPSAVCQSFVAHPLQSVSHLLLTLCSLSVILQPAAAAAATSTLAFKLVQKLVWM
jgi:hypothetical protein